MKTNVNLYSFRQSFINYDRENQFSYNGLTSLFEYLEQYEEDTDTEIELDVIALCCEYTEYKNLEAFKNEHGDEYETIQDVENVTTVIYIDDPDKVENNEGAFIIQNF